MFVVTADRCYHENLWSNVMIKKKKKCWHSPNSLSYPSQPGIIVPPASHLTLSLSAHPSLQSALHCPRPSSPLLSFLLLLLSLHLRCSLYVQGAVTAWDRGQAPIQKELRDSHHERRESCQSGLHIAARGGASSWGSGLILTQGEGPQENSPSPKNTYHHPLWKERGRCDYNGGATTVHPRQQTTKNWTLACENLLDELIWNQRIYIYEKKYFQSGLDQHFMQKKKRKSCDKQT